MPYFLYKITPGPTPLIKNLEKITQYDSFKEAKSDARTRRAEASDTDTSTFKVIFAESELHAEEMLMEKRDQPILREWEK